jgi:hypothetical protein
MVGAYLGIVPICIESHEIATPQSGAATIKQTHGLAPSRLVPLPARTLGIDRTLHTYQSPAQISTRHLVAGWSGTVRLNE